MRLPQSGSDSLVTPGAAKAASRRPGTSISAARPLSDASRLLGVSGHGLDRLGRGLLGRAEAVFELAQPSARLLRGLVVGRPREAQGSEPCSS